MIITEAFYFYVIVALFFFMVDFPSRYVKMFFGLTLLFAKLSIVLTSIVMTLYLVRKGPSELKKDDKLSKLRRAEKEAIERAEKEERKLKILKSREVFNSVEMGSNIQDSRPKNSQIGAEVDLWKFPKEEKKCIDEWKTI